MYWRTSWGGASYTGPGTVAAATNDNDGNTNPPFPGPLPSTGGYALQYTPACPTLSTTNAADYAVTGGPATFVNNDLASFVVVGSGLPEVSALPGWARVLLVAMLAALGLSYPLAVRRRSA